MDNSLPSLSPCPPGYLPAAAIAGAEPIHRAFLKTLETRLGELLHSPVSAALAETRQDVMANFLSAAGTGFFIVALEGAVTPSCGRAALGLPAELLRAVLDILLAKPTGAPDVKPAPVTEIELHILRDFFEAFTGTLRKAWASSFAISFNRLSIGVEDAKQILEASSGHAVLILTSRLKVGGVDHTFDLALPGFLVRMAEARAASAQTHDRLSPPVEAVVSGPLGAAIVELEGVLRGVTLRMGDLLALKAEQILLLGAPVDARFDCLVNGKAQFAGEMQAGANRHCFQVETINA